MTSHVSTLLSHSSLISIGKFYDAGCEASLNYHTTAVTKDEQVLLQVTRDLMTDLFRVPLQSIDRPTNQINHLHQVNGKESSIKYLHATSFIPVQDTWGKSVNRGYFNTWPGLMAKDIHKMTKAEATIKRHLAKIRENFRLTTTNKNSGEEQGHSNPVQERDNNKKEIVVATVE